MLAEKLTASLYVLDFHAKNHDETLMREHFLLDVWQTSRQIDQGTVVFVASYYDNEKYSSLAHGNSALVFMFLPTEYVISIMKKHQSC